MSKLLAIEFILVIAEKEQSERVTNILERNEIQIVLQYTNGPIACFECRCASQDQLDEVIYDLDEHEIEYSL